MLEENKFAKLILDAFLLSRKVEKLGKKEKREWVLENIGFDSLDEKDCLKALRKCGLSLRFIDKQTEEMKLVAVTQNGYALQNIYEQSDAVIDAAIEQNPDAYIYVRR